MEFDLLAFVEAAYPVIALGAGITVAIGTWLGKMGAQGRLQLGLTSLAGLIIGVLGMVAKLGGWPVDFPTWFAVILVGLITPGVAVGVYETGVHIAAKSG
jgi:hypothetical protein